MIANSNFKSVFLFAFTIACSLRAGLLVAQTPMISSPRELWHDIDPRIEPLEEELITTWNDDEGTFEKLFFTGESIEGEKVRVFAIRGTPPPNSLAAGERWPGVLHIHGGGQTASLEWVKFWMRRGYACVSFDFCGRWEDRTEFTDWGPLKQGNMADAEGGLQILPTPRASSWYHWALISRRALTLLEQHSNVDRQRLGIFGVSVGGTLCWMVAGADERVRAAVPIYGCGYNYDNSKTAWGFEELSPELSAWQKSVSAEAHAPLIRCPVLLLNATNDFHGWLDDGPRILEAVPRGTRSAYSPNWNHHISASEAVNLPAWMDFALGDGAEFPKSPVVDIDLDQVGVPRARVTIDEHQEIVRVDVYYALGTQTPPNRFWRHIKATKNEHGWQASLPVMDIAQEARAFANVYYARPVCLSSNLAPFVPAQLGTAQATLAWSAELNVPGGWRYMAAHTDPSIERTYLLPPEDSGDPSELRPNVQLFGDRVPINVVSNFLGDPQFAGRPGMALAFDYDGRIDGGLEVTITSQTWTPRSKSYRTKLSAEELAAESGIIRLTLDRLRSENGEPPMAWAELDTLQIQGEAASEPAPVVGRFRWEPN